VRGIGRERPGARRGARGQAVAAGREEEGGPRVGPVCKRERRRIGARLGRLGLLGRFWLGLGFWIFFLFSFIFFYI
jgi:hypothetical protein